MLVTTWQTPHKKCSTSLTTHYGESFGHGTLAVQDFFVLYYSIKR